MKTMRVVTVARALLLVFLCVPCTALAADRLSDLVDSALTESQAIPEWTAGETYQPGTERTAPNPDLLDDDGNPAVFIWQLGGSVEHTAGATWDEAERALWAPLGVYVSPSTAGPAELPTSLGGGTWGGAHANTFTSNGIWHGTNTGALAGAPLGNWSFQLDVVRIGEWIVQRYNADNSWIIYRRESYDGGATWTPWRGV